MANLFVQNVSRTKGKIAWFTAITVQFYICNWVTGDRIYIQKLKTMHVGFYRTVVN